MAELKSCPFCGGEAEVEVHKFCDEMNTYGIKCSKCHTQSFQFYADEKTAVNQWNTRKQQKGSK